MKRPDEIYGPLSRLYVNGAVPPEPVAVILPVLVELVPPVPPPPIVRVKV